ncbi:YveK family protein [Sporosarcina sp. CAU 1771]
MEDEISVQKVFKVIRANLLLIIGLVLFSVSLVGGLSYYVLQPIYQSSTQILINQQKSDESQFNTQDIQTNLQLINTYNVIIKSSVILSKVIDELNLDMLPSQLASKISVSSEQNSQVINVTVQDSNPRKTVEIANTTAEVFQKEIKTLMNTDNVHILAAAVDLKNPAPVKPNPLLNMAIAAVIGLMLGVALAYLRILLNTTVKNEQDIEEFFELAILGVISPITDKEINKTKEFERSRKGERLWGKRKKGGYKQRRVSL